MFPLRTNKPILSVVVLIAVLAGLSGCRESGTNTPAQLTPAVTNTPQATPTITPTPEPLALLVNGEGVSLAEYQAQLAQLVLTDEQNENTRTPEEQRQLVLDELIDQTLLAQAARENGFNLDDAALQARIDALAAQIGGQAALDEWMAAYGYAPESFRSALERAAASAWQRDQVIATIPEIAEQVRVQQILVRNRETAEDLHGQLEAGADFASLAMRYDPITGGILGWFPRGYLTQPAVEEAAFALQPGEYSPIIETDFGFHIVFVIEREAERILSVDARTAMQHKALAAWLESQRDTSNIEILAP